MILKIDTTGKIKHQVRGFAIEILYPGQILKNDDSGIGTIGRIDHAMIKGGTVVPMHPHEDDEILTYLRSGKVLHKDSEGHEEFISAERLMMMNAGAIFRHEEHVQDEAGTLQALQIFLRPEVDGMKPMVQFYDLPQVYSLNEWRPIAGPDQNFPLLVRSQTWLYDMRLEQSKAQSFVGIETRNLTCLLYVFQGQLVINKQIEILTGECVIIELEDIQMYAASESDLVLFITDKASTFSEGGMYSGNISN